MQLHVRQNLSTAFVCSPPLWRGHQRTCGKSGQAISYCFRALVLLSATTWIYCTIASAWTCTRTVQCIGWAQTQKSGIRTSFDDCLQTFLSCSSFIPNWWYLLLQVFLHFSLFGYILFLFENTISKNISLHYPASIKVTNNNYFLHLCHNQFPKWAILLGRPKITLKMWRTRASRFHVYHFSLQKWKAHLGVCSQRL